MRRSVLPIYALILLETLVWIAMVPLAPTFADEFGLNGVETGMILAAASLAALVVAFPLGVLADRLGARRVTIASAVLFTLATLGQGLAVGVLDAPARASGVRRRLRGGMGSRNGVAVRLARRRAPHESSRGGHDRGGHRLHARPSARGRPCRPL